MPETITLSDVIIEVAKHMDCVQQRACVQRTWFQQRACIRQIAWAWYVDLGAVAKLGVVLGGVAVLRACCGQRNGRHMSFHPLAALQQTA